MKKIAILGSTGSIGINTLKVLENLGGFRPECLTAYSNLITLAQQANKYRPRFLGIDRESDYFELKRMLNYHPKEVFFGQEGLKKICRLKSCPVFVVAIVGCAALLPLIELIKHDKKILLANKESLVSGGKVVSDLLKKSKAQLIPVDSEHNAIFQALEGEDPKKIKRIILTASGGPFFNLKVRKLRDVTPYQALAHPKWNMGKKISVDSATLMNKGLEVIEASWLFKVDVEKIEILIHREVIVHSMVEFIDGNIKAILGPTDMKLPIQYALTYPERRVSPLTAGYSDLKKFTFEKPDFKKFPALKLCYRAAARGGTLPAVLNASNEVAVDAFIKGEIRFTDIPKVIEKVMGRDEKKERLSLSSILERDAWARRQATKLCRV